MSQTSPNSSGRTKRASRLLLRRRELLSRQLRQHALPRDLVAHELVELLGRVIGGRLAVPCRAPPSVS